MFLIGLSNLPSGLYTPLVVLLAVYVVARPDRGPRPRE